MQNNLLRRPAVSARLGIKKSTTYTHQSLGLITTSVACGPRAVGWPADEIDAIVRARISGASEDAIKQLVIDLTAARKRSA